MVQPLDVNDVLVLDGLVYQITKVQRMRDKETVSLAANTSAIINDLKQNLTPDNDQVYFLEEFTFTGPTTHMLQYPKGNPINTPHGLDMEMEEWMTPWLLNLFIKPATYPTLVSSNPVNAIISQDIWFFGYIYWIQVITTDQAAALVEAGGKQLPVTTGGP